MAKLCPRCAGSGAVDSLEGKPWSEAQHLPGNRELALCGECGGRGWDGPSPDEERETRVIDPGPSRGRRR